ncbi:MULTISPECIES: DUF5313 family protein [Actinomadura]|uniref:DUF5313 family protein n=1 Tax=Actinomadura yumaensis TaxID=111807 RepID=A0ABW2CXH3_9ACTN|nr:DUF5313 family protein [Actinomadura sp. J1-007]MWK36065.1 hypothetical protein [Actinomadura sp. J1-007]
MARLPGDPGPLGRARYALGFRLPPRYRDWVRHDLVDAGWRLRLLVRHLCLMIPVCLLLALLPGSWWLRALVALLALLTSMFTVAVSADEMRLSRLRRHGLTPPDPR